MSDSDVIASSVGVNVGDTTPRYRSAAVARMVRMPVATLRIWERRYQVSAPVTSAAGHRLYCAADIQRLALLKQLTELGHAIGSIAALDMTQLRQVARTHASTMSRQPAPAPAPGSTERLQRPVFRAVLVGPLLAARLQRPQFKERLRHELAWAAVHASLDAAVAATPLAAVGSVDAGPVDLLLVQLPGLQPGLLGELEGLATRVGAGRIAVVYGFSAESVGQDLAAAGVSLQREPLTDAALATWLDGLCGDLLTARAALNQASKGAIGSAEPLATLTEAALSDWLLAGQVSARRFDDGTLIDMAGLSSTIGCECPRHVAELLMQLTQFEAYCADCRSRSPADADLHAYLGRVSGLARSLFERSLERVAVHEGLILAE